MLVTVFSDAGLCHETGIATWGAWVKSQRGVARGGGVLRAKLRTSSVAEAQAALNAIHLGLAQRVIHPGDHIILQTDNDQVEMAMAGKTGKRSRPHADHAQLLPTRRAFAKLVAGQGLTLEWRHVKGHAKEAGAQRGWVNDYCDKVCRFFLRLERHTRHPGRFRGSAPTVAPHGIEHPLLQPVAA